MEIPDSALQKLRSLSDDELRSAIGDIADALGASASQKRRAQNNVNYIRGQLNNPDRSSLVRQINTIDKEKQNEIFRKLKLK